MKRAAIALATTLALAVAIPANAEMTDAQRKDFRAEVRAYLLDNPEVLIEAMDVLDQRQSQAKAVQDEQLVQVNSDAILNDGFSWVGGNPDGDVTLVEFFDYRCGYCRRARDEVAELVKSDGNIRFILKEFPILGPQSELSSRFAIAVRQLHGDDAYKSVHDALMAFKGDVDKTALRRLAGTLGIDPAPVLARMDAPEVTHEIDEIRALAGRLQIRGTPTFVVGDRMMRGYVPLAGMRQTVVQVRTD